MPDGELILQVGGQRYGGWKSVRVTRSLEQIAGTFEVGVSEKWPGAESAYRIPAGADVVVSIGAERVIGGYVDDVGRSYDAGRHEIAIRGRDKTGDLVDCSAIYGSGTWQNAKIEKIAKDLCGPFGIVVSTNTDTGARISFFRINPGESVFEALERAARQKGLLLMSDGLGGLVIGRAGLSRVSTALMLGKNILSGSLEVSLRERYSKYTVKGQFLEENGGLFAQYKGTATDTQVPRYRPLDVIAEAAGDIGKFTERATWERNVRAGRSTRVTYTVQGWSHDSGLWKPGELVTVWDEEFGIEGDELIVASVAYTLDDRGHIAELSLTLPEAFDLLQLPDQQGQWQNI